MKEKLARIAKLIEMLPVNLGIKARLLEEIEKILNETGTSESNSQRQ